jgi:DNA-binding Xre family transcriptional regulator
MPVAELRLVDLWADKMKREKRVIPVTEIAHACGIKRQNAYKWLNNEIKCAPLKTIAALCLYFECTPNDLIVVRREHAS